VPRFFDKAKLTPVQKDNWDRATTLYAQLKKEAYSSAIHPFMIDLMWNGAGDEKSALFSRLLEGKDPLPNPPPCYYSYPWYSVVEDKKQHAVDIGFYKGSLTIGQDVYKIRQANKAAKALTSFTKRHLYKREGVNEWSRVQRRHIASLLNADPKWTVEKNGYEFEVSYQQKIHSSRGRRFCYPGQFKCRSGFSGGNPSFINIIKTGMDEYRDQLKEYHARLEQGDEAYFKDQSYPGLRAHFDNAPPKPLTPEQAYWNDWVEVLSDGFGIQCINDLTAQNNTD